jgi:hypothetical protein
MLVAPAMATTTLAADRDLRPLSGQGVIEKLGSIESIDRLRGSYPGRATHARSSRMARALG